MAYVDYPYYQDFYLGNLIRDPTSFGDCAERASEYLDATTFGRLVEQVPDEYSVKVQKCCCALADAIYTYNAYGNGADSAAGAKTSESIGAYSVSYAGQAESIAAMLSGDTSGLLDYLKSICMRYIGTTGLMYRGID